MKTLGIIFVILFTIFTLGLGVIFCAGLICKIFEFAITTILRIMMKY